MQMWGGGGGDDSFFFFFKGKVKFPVLHNTRDGSEFYVPYLSHYRRRWLLSIGAYSFCQQENERLTANMHLKEIPLITMGGVIVINASGLEYCR